eukprot:TRINITY_DN11908_c0_g1_i2.p1 TRINITY_DN11908_c0_g1~~TRINITY_DN11908_c0_g1_i2.p1  ORF type:complete len:512 (+),score=26.79 TRINITY_DN11908_c0_g1_i2:48-1583(+)
MPKSFSNARNTEALDDVFNDLASRFLVNLPDEELQSFERLFFQLEQAHWNYDDFYRPQNPELPEFDLKSFCFHFFQYHPVFESHRESFDDYFSNFRDYVSQVPACGGILLEPSMTKCLLVSNYKGSSWSFPRGKINKEESEFECAIREVYEETGFDMRPCVSPQDSLQVTTNSRRVVLFIARDVSENTVFETKTRKEISRIQWFSIDDLVRSNDSRDHALPRNKFFLVFPFLEKLRKWIARQRRYASPEVKQAVEEEVHPRVQASPPPKNTKASQQIRDEMTFGNDAHMSWSPEQMFADNERLFGVRTTWDTSHGDIPVSNCKYKKLPPQVQPAVLTRAPDPQLPSTATSSRSSKNSSAVSQSTWSDSNDSHHTHSHHTHSHHNHIHHSHSHHSHHSHSDGETIKSHSKHHSQSRQTTARASAREREPQPSQATMEMFMPSLSFSNIHSNSCSSPSSSSSSDNDFPTTSQSSRSSPGSVVPGQVESTPLTGNVLLDFRFSMDEILRPLTWS